VDVIQSPFTTTCAAVDRLATVAECTGLLVGMGRDAEVSEGMIMLLGGQLHCHACMLRMVGTGRTSQSCFGKGLRLRAANSAGAPSAEFGGAEEEEESYIH
jgi:hypothetical protein